MCGLNSYNISFVVLHICKIPKEGKIDIQNKTRHPSCYLYTKYVLEASESLRSVIVYTRNVPC
jgi:thiaminase